MNRPADFGHVQLPSELRHIYRITRLWRYEMATAEFQTFAPNSILGAGEIPQTLCAVSETSFN